MNFLKVTIGKRGEDLALSFLRQKGYKIIERNYKTRLGEIDIIGNDSGCISFIEVRSKNTDTFGLPEYSINKKKQDRISRIALSYIKRFNLEESACRFDVVCIEDVNRVSPKIRLIKNAFELNSKYKY